MFLSELPVLLQIPFPVPLVDGPGVSGLADDLRAFERVQHLQGAEARLLGDNHLADAQLLSPLPAELWFVRVHLAVDVEVKGGPALP